MGGGFFRISMPASLILVGLLLVGQFVVPTRSRGQCKSQEHRMYTLGTPHVYFP